ncbi:MAG: UbiX family flavin prenyltransferase [Desulfobulbus sp.]|jgi:4-hydroxy-3-polyprenylbenzoate decarboxylase
MNPGEPKQRIVVGLSGASGAILGIELLRALHDLGRYETHLVVSAGAAQTIPLETGTTVEAVRALAHVCHDNDNLAAAIASGTFRTVGMAVVPCSMKTVAGIASGYSDNLLLRAADVTLKEGRPLVLVPRECPLSTIHLRNLLTVAEAGAVVMPPMVTYYTQPAGIDDMNRHLVGKVLARLGIDLPDLRRWGEDP